jgi:hypothetical protein
VWVCARYHQYQIVGATGPRTRMLKPQAVPHEALSSASVHLSTLYLAQAATILSQVQMKLPRKHVCMSGKSRAVSVALVALLLPSTCRLDGAGPPLWMRAHDGIRQTDTQPPSHPPVRYIRTWSRVSKSTLLPILLAM